MVGVKLKKTYGTMPFTLKKVKWLSLETAWHNLLRSGKRGRLLLGDNRAWWRHQQFYIIPEWLGCM